MVKLTQDESRIRELEIGSAAAKNGKDPAREIAKDRAKRWAELVPTIEVPVALEAWVVSMTAEHGPTCDYHNHRNVGWVTALLICRYGEAEYFWPSDFSEKDVARAAEWLGGKTPTGVEYSI